MRERLVTYLRHPWLIIARRSVMVLLVFIVLGNLADAVERWESPFYGASAYGGILGRISLIGIWGVWLAVVAMLGGWGLRRWLRYRREQLAAQAAEAERSDEDGVQLELPLEYPPPAPRQHGALYRWWDVWLLAVTLTLCIPLEKWYDYQSSRRSEFVISCSAVSSEGHPVRAVWNSDEACAEGVLGSTPAATPHIHHFLLPDGDFSIHCGTAPPVLSISHIRSSRRFTLTPNFNKEDQVELYICRISTDAERKRVMTLLHHYMENPMARRPRIRRMPFTRCQDSSVLYLDYGEYVLLPIPLGFTNSFAPALIYISLQPCKS